MLKLTLLRHAKSSWDYPELIDFLRPLNKRGYRQGQQIVECFPPDVDVIWCSPAIRAYTTAHCLIRVIPEHNSKLVLVNSIYEANKETLLRLLKQGEDNTHIALIGHNPGLEELVYYLTGSSVTLKTAHNALLLLNIDYWEQIDAGCAQVSMLWRPDI